MDLLLLLLDGHMERLLQGVKRLLLGGPKLLQSSQVAVLLRSQTGLEAYDELLDVGRGRLVGGARGLLREGWRGGSGW